MTLNQNSSTLGTWTVNFLPDGGGRYLGVLEIFHDRAVFTAKFDTSDLGRTLFMTAGLGAINETVGAAYGIASTDSDTVIVTVPKTHIASAELHKSGLMKGVRIITTDGTKLNFSYGMLSVKKLLAALQPR